MIAVLENIERVLKGKRKDKHARYVALDIVRQEKRKLQANKPVGKLGGSPVYLTPASRKNVDAFLKRGQFIQAIKEVRTATGLGLKEAKTFVESLPNYRGF